MSESKYHHLYELRRYELRRVISRLPPGQRVLEIGAGAGWQARLLAENGFDVVAIDVESSRYKRVREWPVIPYDGVHIPLADHSVDVVFSSNVLEHIPYVEAYQSEIQRVLQPGGLAIHLMPTTTWRAWTSLVFYPFVLKTVLQRFTVQRRTGSHTGETQAERPASLPRPKRRLAGRLWPARHGVKGNSITELYYFSHFRWARLFERTGWQIESISPNRLFYTGHSLFGARLNVRIRRWLSHVLGSACQVYVLTPGAAAKDRS
jgi:SAM-dependent methyltransferase